MIEVVYSIGVRNSATEATVQRFCEHFNQSQRALDSLIWEALRKAEV